MPSGKVQALLAYLGVRPGQAHLRDQLAALLWDGAPSRRARHRLRQALLELRRALPPGPGPLLLEQGDTLAVDASVVDVDVAAFETAAADDRPASLARAAALYGGDLLEGLRVQSPAFEEWLLSERERLRELALEVLTRLLAHQLATGPPEAAVRTAARLLRLDPLQEAVHRALMRLHAAQGRRAAALRQYETCVAVLQRELGADPEAATRELYRELLQAPVTADALLERPAAVSRETLLPPLPSETPFVGRRTELDRLRQARAVAWGGQGQVIVILGEAGVGKSRLVEELLADAGPDARVLVGRAHESETILPFGLWIEAFRTARLMPEVAGRTRLGPSERAELARLFPELGEAPPPDTGAGPGRTRLFEAMTRLVGQLASEAPVLLLFEDLQWADELSVHLLAYVARRLADGRLLLVATARDEELVDAPVVRQILGELQREPRSLRLGLSGLSRVDTLELVRLSARVGLDPAALDRLGETIWGASEGNPFMVVEAMRGAPDDGAPAPSASASLPERVRDTVGRRLERLGSRARRLVTLAAAIGQAFEFPLLQRSAGLSPVEAAEGVEELVGRRILKVVDDRLDFTHDWIRVVAYDRLLPPARPLIHAAVGEALETLHAGRLYETHDRLAYHYARTADGSKAIEYLERFAEQAARGYAHADAARALEDAVARIGALPAEARDRRRLELRLRQAHSLHLLGRLREILDVLLPERDRVERLDDPRVTGQYYLRVGHTHSVLADRRHAAECIGRAIEAATAGGDAPTLGKAHYVAAVEAVYAGRQADGGRHGREAIRLLADAGEPWWLGLAYWITGLSALWLGELDAALDAERRALGFGEAIGDSRVQAFAAWTTGLVLAARDDWAGGLDWCRRARELSRDPVNSALADAFAGTIHVERGDPTAARPLLAGAVEAFWQFDYRQAVAQFTAALADAHRLAGDLDTARRLATDALSLGRQTDFPLAVGWAQRTLGRTALAAGDHGGAARHLTAGLDTALAMGAGLEVARSRLALAELAGIRRDQLAELAGIRRDPGAAAEQLRAAHRLFSGMRAPRQVERIEALATALNVELDGSRPGRE